MEGLLLLIASFFSVPLFFGLTLLIEALGIILSAIGQLLGISIQSKESSWRKYPTISPVAMKWITRSCVALFLVTVLSLILINFIFLEPVVRFAADRVEAKTGIDISYTKMKGNIFSGYFLFSEVSLNRSNNDVSILKARTNFLFG
jgi:hypothetical protein